jgi:hypothetical protein
MSNRVTKAMAEEAASQLSEKAFDEKIKEATEHCRSVALSLYEKYIPKPVRDAGEQYVEVYTKECYLDFALDGASYYDYIRIRIPDRFFPKLRLIILQPEDFKLLQKSEKSREKLIQDKQKYVCDVTLALMNLRTEKNVREQFPEALPYMNFTSCTALVPNLGKLRTLLKQ